MPGNRLSVTTHRRGIPGLIVTGFTLIELLVVLSIVALLVALLLPSLNGALAAARRVACGSNMRQVGLAVTGYTNDHKGSLPYWNNGPTQAWEATWTNPWGGGPLLMRYLSGSQTDVTKAMVFNCASADPTGRWEGYTHFGVNLNMFRPNQSTQAMMRQPKPSETYLYADKQDRVKISGPAGYYTFGPNKGVDPLYANYLHIVGPDPITGLPQHEIRFVHQNTTNILYLAGNLRNLHRDKVPLDTSYVPFYRGWQDWGTLYFPAP